MRGVAGDAARVARLVKVEQPQTQLGKGEQVVAGPGEEIDVLDGQFCTYGDEAFVIDKATQASRLVMP